MLQPMPKSPTTAKTRIKNIPDRDRTGELIQTFRKRAGMTQLQVSYLLDVPVGTVGQWEKDFKRVQPWALDMMCYVYGLSAHEGWMLFYEAGYALYDQPPAIIHILKAYSELPSHIQTAADDVIKGASELLETWAITTDSVGSHPPTRAIPSLRDVEDYWENRSGSRYHSRRISFDRQRNQRPD